MSRRRVRWAIFMAIARYDEGRPGQIGCDSQSSQVIGRPGEGGEGGMGKGELLKDENRRERRKRRRHGRMGYYHYCTLLYGTLLCGDLWPGCLRAAERSGVRPCSPVCCVASDSKRGGAVLYLQIYCTGPCRYTMKENAAVCWLRGVELHSCSG